MWSPSHRSTLTALASSSDLGVATPPHAAAQQTFGNGIRAASIADGGARSRSRPGRCDTDEVHDQVATLVTAYRRESGDIGGHGT
jgi:hypothetical protein